MKKSNLPLIAMSCVLLFVSVTIGHASNQSLEFDWKSFPTDGAFGLTWSPDNLHLALSNRYGNQIWIFDLQTKTVEKRIDLPDIPENVGPASASWSPDGSLIAVAQGNIYLVDAATGDIVQTYTKKEAHSTEHISIAAIKWSSDSKSLAAMETVGYIYLFNVGAKELLKTIDLDYQEEGVSSAFDWSPDNTLLAAPLLRSRSIGFWDKDGNPATAYMQEDKNKNLETNCWAANESKVSDTYSINWSRDGKHLAVGAKYGLRVCHFEDTDTLKSQLLDDEPTSSAVWSPDDHWLVSTNAYDPACWIKIFDVTKQFELVQTLQGSACSASSMAWSPDGQSLAAGNNAELWIGTVK